MYAKSSKSMYKMIVGYTLLLLVIASGCLSFISLVYAETEDRRARFSSNEVPDFSEGVFADGASKNVVEVVDMVVAAIDANPILLSDLNAAMKEKGLGLSSESAIFSNESIKTLRELVQLKIVQIEAESLGITVSDADIESYQEEVRLRSGLSRSAFVDELKRQKLTPENYAKQIRTQLLQTRVVAAHIRSKLTVTDADVERYLQEFPSKRPKAGEMRLQEVVIPFGDAALSYEAALDEYRKIKQAVDSGRKLEEVAGPYVSGLGYIDPLQLKEIFSAVVVDLPVAKLSRFIVNDSAIHAFFVIAKNTGTEIDSNLKQEIKNYLTQKTFQQEAERYLRDELPKAHDVEILIDK